MEFLKQLFVWFQTHPVEATGSLIINIGAAIIYSTALHYFFKWFRNEDKRLVKMVEGEIVREFKRKLMNNSLTPNNILLIAENICEDNDAVLDLNNERVAKFLLKAGREISGENGVSSNKKANVDRKINTLLESEYRPIQLLSGNQGQLPSGN